MMLIETDEQRRIAIQAIQNYDNRKLEFEVGASYQWHTGLAMPNQGKTRGPLKCIYIGVYQGLFEDSSTYKEPVGAFENSSGLHIIATAHLKNGHFIKIS